MSEVDDLQLVAAANEIVSRITDKNNFVRAVFSGRRRNFHPEAERIDIRPVLIKEDLLLQLMFRTDSRVVTQNYPFAELAKLELVASGYANFLVESRDERFEVRIGKKGQVFRKSSRANLEPSYDHDHKKKRILEENDSLLVAVGISDSSGRIKPSMRDKYLQVEEFLRILENGLDKFALTNPIRIIDLGCGHAYLTFAVLRYLQKNNLPAKFIGVDVKAETRLRNEKIAVDMQIAQYVTFVDSTISDFPVEPVDIAIALHACDTATDDALTWAVEAEAKLILAAPCCHHDLHKQVQKAPAALTQIFDHGILAVRQMDLLTDALRAALLECVGYRAEVFEFISGDHTARNLMIRASRGVNLDGNLARSAEKIREYRHTCELWGIKPALERRLKLGEIRAND